MDEELEQDDSQLHLRKFFADKGKFRFHKTNFTIFNYTHGSPNYNESAKIISTLEIKNTLICLYKSIALRRMKWIIYKNDF